MPEWTCALTGHMVVVVVEKFSRYKPDTHRHHARSVTKQHAHAHIRSSSGLLSCTLTSPRSSSIVARPSLLSFSHITILSPQSKKARTSQGCVYDVHAAAAGDSLHGWLGSSLITDRARRGRVRLRDRLPPLPHSLTQ